MYAHEDVTCEITAKIVRCCPFLSISDVQVTLLRLHTCYSPSLLHNRACGERVERTICTIVLWTQALFLILYHILLNEGQGTNRAHCYSLCKPQEKNSYLKGCDGYLAHSVLSLIKGRRGMWFSARWLGRELTVGLTASRNQW